MRFVMNPDMVYQYPIWAVGLLLVGAAVFGAVLVALCARRLLPIELRLRQNDVAAAIFSIIGVTYAVLLAFVAMLAWQGFNRAKAASYAEAAVIGDVYNLSAGLGDPEKSSIRNEIIGYARRVVNVEWPAQAEGRIVDQDSIYLNGLNEMALALHPSDQADGDLRSLLLQATERLWAARQERLLAAQTTIPGIVWFVVIVGGALTVAFGSFLGAPRRAHRLRRRPSARRAFERSAAAGRRPCAIASWRRRRLPARRPCRSAPRRHAVRSRRRGPAHCA